jgi:hypothetical protein
MELVMIGAVTAAGAGQAGEMIGVSLRAGAGMLAPDLGA